LFKTIKIAHTYESLYNQINSLQRDSHWERLQANSKAFIGKKAEVNNYRKQVAQLENTRLQDKIHENQNTRLNTRIYKKQELKRKQSDQRRQKASKRKAPRSYEIKTIESGTITKSSHGLLL